MSERSGYYENNLSVSKLLLHFLFTVIYQAFQSLVNDLVKDAY